MTVHPPIEYLPDNHPSFQASGAWYCAIPGAAPGGYSTNDGTSGPSAGDKVVIKQSFREPAKRAFIDMQYRRRPQKDDVVALYLHAHEFFHTYVRLDSQGKALPDDLKRYSHPDKALPAIGHAIFVSNFGINAFTRILRWNRTPGDAWEAFMKWFAAQMKAGAI